MINCNCSGLCNSIWQPQTDRIKQRISPCIRLSSWQFPDHFALIDHHDLTWKLLLQSCLHGLLLCHLQTCYLFSPSVTPGNEWVKRLQLKYTLFGWQVPSAVLNDWWMTKWMKFTSSEAEWRPVQGHQMGLVPGKILASFRLIYREDCRQTGKVGRLKNSSGKHLEPLFLLLNTLDIFLLYYFA